MKNTYDWEQASRLVPLLEAIFGEVEDRRRSIRTMENSLARMKHEGAPPAAIAQVVARLAVERRELRLTSKEFERLGCVVDSDDPSRVAIPGMNGRLESGFLWDSDLGEVHLAAGTQVA